MGNEEQVARLGQTVTPQMLERPAKSKSFIAAAIGLLVASSALITLIVIPEGGGQIYSVSDGDIGKPAPRNIKADRDYKIPDEKSTEESKRKAAEAVKSIYYYDTTVGREISDNLREAFKVMRDVFDGFPEFKRKEVKKEDTSSEGKEGAPQKPKKPAEEVKKKLNQKTAANAEKNREEEIQAERKAAFEAEIETRKNDFIKVLGIVPSEPEFRAFMNENFSSETAEFLSDIVARVMSGLVVSERKLLEGEQGKGITVIHIDNKGDELEEETVSSIEVIKDLAETREFLRREIIAGLMERVGALSEREAIAGVVSRMLRPNLAFSYGETERRKSEASAQVKPVFFEIKKGEMIIREGDRLLDRHLVILRGIADANKDRNKGVLFISFFALMLGLIGILTWFAYKNIRKFSKELKDLAFLASVLVVTVLIARGWIVAATALKENYTTTPFSMWYYATPVMAGAIIVRLILNSETAVVFAVITSVIFGFIADNQTNMGVYALIGSLVGAAAIGQASYRSSILKAGFYTGVANVASVLTLGFMSTSSTAATSSLTLDCVGGFASGIMSAMLVSFLSMGVEDLFGYITNIKLLELANLNHPALREFAMNAPGSYHHSIVVGSLAESGAYSIGANPLLVRVMAYYHDVGKGKAPEFFAENQKSGSNPHKGLSSSLSASVIKGHVDEGVKIAKKYKLGKPILDAITQHHGTTLINFFYNKAVEESTGNQKDAIDELIYRYKGPKPQSREAVLIMIADGCEAAAKSVPVLDEARIRGVVQKKINSLFTDGQFDECNITLRDLHLIANAYTKILTSYYHSRPAYQEPATKERTGIEKNLRPKSGNHHTAQSDSKSTGQEGSDPNKPRSDEGEKKASSNGEKNGSSNGEQKASANGNKNGNKIPPANGDKKAQHNNQKASTTGGEPIITAEMSKPTDELSPPVTEDLKKLGSSDEPIND